eukprot:gene3553-3822_t
MQKTTDLDSLFTYFRGHDKKADLTPAILNLVSTTIKAALPAQDANHSNADEMLPHQVIDRQHCATYLYYIDFQECFAPTSQFPLPPALLQHLQQLQSSILDQHMFSMGSIWYNLANGSADGSVLNRGQRSLWKDTLQAYAQQALLQHAPGTLADSFQQAELNFTSDDADRCLGDVRAFYNQRFLPTVQGRVRQYVQSYSSRARNDNTNADHVVHGVSSSSNAGGIENLHLGSKQMQHQKALVDIDASYTDTASQQATSEKCLYATSAHLKQPARLDSLKQSHGDNKCTPVRQMR